ncbi:MAG TPA: carboxypeptidase-like regulatory domain-containing protein [Planctomycetota bacterium]|nr:carboxypeptidase-like regulatory domain-containing protein [Planctomycetota bacterium]
MVLLVSSMSIECAASQSGSPPAHLTGRVCFETHGIAGAHVGVGSIISGPESTQHASRRLDLADMLTPFSTKPRWLTATTASGEFDVQVLASGDLLLFVDMPGGGPAPLVSVHLVPGETCTVEVEAHGLHVAGRVVEQGSGRALPDATLILTSIPGIEGLPGVTWLPSPPRPATTDAEGRFLVACVPPKVPGILVEHLGHVSRLVDPVAPWNGTLDDALIELEPEAIVEGDLLDAGGGRAAGEMTVFMQREDHRTFPNGEHVLMATATEGHFQVRGVPACRSTLWIYDDATGESTSLRKAPVNGASKEGVIETEAGKTVTLSITLPAGK